MLSNLIYVSTRVPECTDEEINKILHSCKKNNHSADVTGVLLYSNKQFVQYLEGQYRAIASLYDKIKTDSRHKNAIMISSAPISQRLFPSWQMGAKKLDSKAVEFNTDISAEDRRSFQEILDGKSHNAAYAATLIQKVFK